ncbi:MAG TPA: hypothetical protein VK864_09750 [Longimicrobiales bacterium]|nr:hypothetical protein [Longimicrobiales bacterium]
MTSRTISALLVWSGLLPVLAAGQTVPEFDKLRTPSSPAMILLGASPTRIQRPNTPATVAASLMEAFGQDRDRVPSGYALEVAPYWLVPHPDLTLSTYKHGPATVARTFTVSVGSRDSTDSETGESQSMLALGLRTMLLSSTDPLKTDTSCIANASAAAAQLAEAVNVLIGPFIAANPRATEAEIEAERQRVFEIALTNAPPEVRREIEDTKDDCIDLLSVNHGFTLDIAGGGAWAFRDGAWETGRTASAGVWLTPAWHVGDHGNIVGIGSVMWERVAGDDTRMVVDGGVRGIYAWRSFALSAEGVIRRLSGDVPSDTQLRVDVGLDVELRNGIWLTTTFGRDFNADDARSVLAIANIQWNIGDRSIQVSPPK